MGNDTRPQEATGVVYVQRIVELHWQSGWQPTSSRTDDGVDGYIHLRRYGRDTGAVLFAQIKTGSGYRADTKKRPEFVGINVEKLEAHRERWQKQPVPMVMIFVDPTQGIDTPEAWWTDLKASSSFANDRKDYVLLSKLNRFGQHSKGDFFKLCGRQVSDQSLQRIELTTPESMYLSLSEPPKTRARRYYNTWSQSLPVERTNPTLGEIAVNRVGWRHICRKGRKPAHIYQSWQLLGAARRIIAEVSTFTRLGKTVTTPVPQGQDVCDFVGLRAWVTFPHRHESVIQVVLRRHRVFSSDGSLQQSRTWFYSVYELRRDQ